MENVLQFKMRRNAKPLPDVGARFGRLVVVGFYRDANEHNRIAAMVVCDCGAKTTAPLRWLRKGHKRSCGCLKRETVYGGAERATTHGMSYSCEYAAWRSILDRTRNPKNSAFRHYGGRGIGVCERWLVFENFLADMGRRPSPAHSIDRIDNEQGYDAANCRWTTWDVQARNRRGTHIIEYNGERLPLLDAAKKYGVVSRSAVFLRLKRGWTVSDALTIPSQRPWLTRLADARRSHPTDHVVIDATGERAEGSRAAQDLRFDDVAGGDEDLTTPPGVGVMP